MVGARRIRREKMREHQYKGYARSLEKGVEWDGDDNVEHVERAMVRIAREVFGSVRVGRKKPKSV